MRQAFVRRVPAALLIVCWFFANVTPLHGAEHPPPATADMLTTEAPVVPVKTQHQLVIGKTTIAYTAWFEETLLYDANHVPQASISSTSYIRDKVKNSSQRPVLFAFNGGPGASSSPLHFGAFGPRRYQQQPSGSRTLVPNEASLLDAADLVFIDPVGTGFSRERSSGTHGRYLAPGADAQAVLGLIRQWLRTNRREQSPLYIAGESYGGFRVAVMMKDAGDLPIAGLILVSPALDISGTSGAQGNDLPFILELPSMAVAAWQHQKIDRANRTLEQTFDQAAQFAQTDYALGLLKGSTIAPEEMHRLAGTVSSFIGLPGEAIERAHLRVDSQNFLEQLEPGKIVGRLDTRIVASVPKVAANPDRPAAANDPALGLGASNVIKSATAKSYYLNELKVQTERDYLSLSLDVNFAWNWCDLIYEKGPQDPSLYINPTPNIAKVMEKQPHLRLLLLGGYFDMAVPLLEPRYALSHAGVPLGRVSMKALEAPHSTFEGEEGLRAGSAITHAFLRGE